MTALRAAATWARERGRYPRPPGRDVARELRCGCGTGLQRTDHLTQDLGGNVGVEGGCLELLVAEEYLDDADIHLLLEQVGGKAMSLPHYFSWLTIRVCKQKPYNLRRTR